MSRQSVNLMCPTKCYSLGYCDRRTTLANHFYLFIEGDVLSIYIYRCRKISRHIWKLSFLNILTSILINWQREIWSMSTLMRNIKKLNCSGERYQQNLQRCRCTANSAISGNFKDLAKYVCNCLLINASFAVKKWKKNNHYSLSI